MESLRNTASLKKFEFLRQFSKTLRKLDYVLLWILSTNTGLWQSIPWNLVNLSHLYIVSLNTKLKTKYNRLKQTSIQNALIWIPSLNSYSQFSVHQKINLCQDTEVHISGQKTDLWDTSNHTLHALLFYKKAAIPKCYWITIYNSSAL